VAVIVWSGFSFGTASWASAWLLELRRCFFASHQNPTKRIYTRFSFSFQVLLLLSSSLSPFPTSLALSPDAGGAAATSARGARPVAAPAMEQRG